MTNESLAKLQRTQQNLQAISTQKVQVQNQLSELNSAMEELKEASTSYKIVGKIMIAQPRDKLQKELGEQKELLDVRLKTYTNQEEQLKGQLEELQKKVVEEMKNDNSN